MTADLPSSEMFGLSCPECGFTHSATSYEEAAEYSRGHRTHMDHDCCWELPPEFETQGYEIRCYLIQCSECGTEARLDGRKEADAFAADHERFTDHGAPDIKPVERSGTDFMPLSELVSKLRMRGLGDGISVPETVVFASLIRRGNTPQQVDRQIDEALASGALYYSSEYQLATTSG